MERKNTYNAEDAILSAVEILERVERTSIENPYKIKMLVKDALEALKAYKND